MVASADQAGLRSGGDELDFERAGNSAQNRQAQKEHPNGAGPANMPAPGTSTSPANRDLDSTSTTSRRFPASSDSSPRLKDSNSSTVLSSHELVGLDSPSIPSPRLRQLDSSAIPSPRLKDLESPTIPSPRLRRPDSPTTSSPGGDVSGSPGVPRAAIFPSDAVPLPHLPLKKRSANHLRLQLAPRSGSERYSPLPSPTRSVVDRSEARSASPRTERHKILSNSSTVKPDEVSQDGGGAMVSPAVAWTRARGLTSSSQTTPTILRELKQSSSIPDLASFRANQRNMVSSAYRPERGPNSRDTSSSFRSPPTPWKDADEVRASFRSALTNNGEVRSSFRSGYTNASYVTYASSAMDASETTRSSVVTRASSVSDMFYKAKVQGLEDEGLSVEDTISLYANGFTDDELERQLDQGIRDIQSFMPPPQTPQTDKAQPPLPSGSARSEALRAAKPQSSELQFEQKPIDKYSSWGSIVNASTYDFSSLESPIKTANKVDSAVVNEISSPRSPKSPQSIKDDTRVLKSPSMPDLPLSPLDAHPVRLSSKSPPRKEVPGNLFADATVVPPAITPANRAKTLPILPTPRPIEKFEPVPRDRYGFKKVTQYITLEQYDEWDMYYTEYLERRRRKWIALMTQWGLAKDKPIRFPPKSDKVKRYIRKGIPPDWRGAAWFWYAGGPSRIAQNPGLYRRLVKDTEIGFLSDTDREIIERDLNRTFPDNIKFKPDPVEESPSFSTADFPGRNVRPQTSSSSVRSTPQEQPIVKALRRVLQAFAIHQPKIGYCQSLNFLAGMLLIFLDEDEEKAFHLLDIITSVHLPGTHAKILEANVDVGVLMTCIRDSMPAVWAKIDDIDEGRGQISTNRLPTVSLATTSWFMSCFIGNLPIESVLRVWDSFFYEGSKTLFRISLAIFKSGEHEIRNVNEHMEVFQVVQGIPRRLIDASALMESCFKRRNGFGHLSQETLDARRRERRTALQRDRDRKNGQLNPMVEDPAYSQRPDSRGHSGLRRAASKARLRRNQTRRQPMQEAN